MGNQTLDTMLEKIQNFIERYHEVSKEKERVEALSLKKDKEFNEVRKKLEDALKERDRVKKKLDGLIEKIDSLDI